MKKIIKPLSVFCALVISIMLFTFSAFAEENPIKDADGDIMGLAYKGDFHSYPENSLEAILSAGKTGIDGVLVDVSFTKDGIGVLLEADSASRMLDGAVSESVSDYTLTELLSYNLKNATGGPNNPVTQFKTATLEEALETAKNNKIMLAVKTDAENTDAVMEAISNYPDTIVYITGEQDDVKFMLGRYNCPDYTIITEKRGNIVFLQIFFIDFCWGHEAAGVVLKTTNRYGVNFNQTVLKHFNGRLRAIADTSDSRLAGAREDTEKWWNDLVSRGYSVIITGDAQGFADYKTANIAAREKLQSAYTKYTENWELPQFGSIVFNDYKKAYTDAISEAETLLADNSSSTQDMNDCCAALIKACDDIDLNYEALEQGKAGMTVSVPRICLCIGAVIAVVTVQIFFFRRREKN